MLNNPQKIIAILFILISITIALGAFGAHGLREKLSTNSLESWQTGIRYLFYGFIMCFVLIFLHAQKPMYQIPFLVLFSGTLIFGISVLLAASSELIGTGFKTFGMIAPIGGLLMIVSMLIAAFNTLKK